MGAIRGILLVFVCVFLFISLLLLNIFLTLSMSLDYKNVQAELGVVLNNILEGQNVTTIVEKNFYLMEFYCQSNPESEYSLSYDGSGYDFEISCFVISQGSDAVVDYIVNDFVDEFYYKDYDCEFLDCMEKTGSPLFLVSEKAKNYWNSKFYFALLVSLGLIGFLFFLAEKKSNIFIIAGSLLMVVSLPFMKLDWALSLISGESLLGLLNVFLSESYTIFVISLVLGILLLGVGILFKIFKVGFKISDICSKFSKKGKKVSEEKNKQIVKKEISEKEKINPNKKSQISKILGKEKKSK